MRTRTSPRNQEILYRALGGRPNEPEPIMGPPEDRSYLLSKAAKAANQRQAQAALIRAARKK